MDNNIEMKDDEFNEALKTIMDSFSNNTQIKARQDSNGNVQFIKPGSNNELLKLSNEELLGVEIYINTFNLFDKSIETDERKRDNSQENSPEESN